MQDSLIPSVATVSAKIEPTGGVLIVLIEAMAVTSLVDCISQRLTEQCRYYHL